MNQDVNTVRTVTKTALVTGASSGIGREFARLLAERGYDAVLVARREERLQELKAELESLYDVKAHVVALDLASPGATLTLLEKLKDLEIEVLINNAGFGLKKDFLESDLSRMTNMLQLNVRVLTELTHVFGGPMQARGKGYILQVASIAAFQPTPGMAIYSATKAYVSSLCEAMHHELKSKGVIVTTLYPGSTDTEFFDVAGQNVSNKVKSLAETPRKVACTGLKALFKGQSSVTSGITNKINGVMIRFMPRAWAAKISHYVVKKFM